MARVIGFKLNSQEPEKATDFILFTVIRRKVKKAFFS